MENEIVILQERVIPRRARALCPTVETGEGLTEQSHKDQCDINQILKDYTRTGFIKHAKQNEGQYDDVTGIDFQTSMETVARVKSLFEGLPAEIRKEFDHQPAKFLDYVQDPANGEELAARGILKGNDGVDISGVHNAAMTKTQWNDYLAAREAAKAAAEAAELASAAEVVEQGGTPAQAP